MIDTPIRLQLSSNRVVLASIVSQGMPTRTGRIIYTSTSIQTLIDSPCLPLIAEVGQDLELLAGAWSQGYIVFAIMLCCVLVRILVVVLPRMARRLNGS